MEFRKLISFGKTSYVISIPKSWIIRNNLSKGDLLSLEEYMGNLVVSPKATEKEPEVKEALINIDKKSINYIRREIIQNYINNVSKMMLTGNELKEKAVGVRNILHNLVALEIMEQTKDRIVTKDFLNMETISIQDTIRKIDIIIRSIIIDTKTAEDISLYDNISHRDEDVNRLTFVVLRAIKNALDNPPMLKKYGLTYSDLLVYWQIANTLERFADDCKRIAKSLSAKDISAKSKKEIIKLYTEAEQLYLKIMKSFYNKDKKAAFDILDDMKSLIGKCSDLSEKQKTIPAILILEKLKRMVSNEHTIARIIYI